MFHWLLLDTGLNIPRYETALPPALVIYMKCDPAVSRLTYVSPVTKHFFAGGCREVQAQRNPQQVETRETDK